MIKARWARLMRGRGLRAMGLIGLAGLGGCAREGGGSIGQTYEVKGQFLLANGSPLSAGRVTFVSKAGTEVPASGEIGPDGRFSLTTKTSDDGAVPGEYKVRVEPATGGDAKRPSKPPFPLKYIDEDSSGLVVTVRSEPNRLEPIRLK